MTGSSKYIEEVKQVVCDTLRLDPALLDATTSFDDVGVSSRQRVQMLAMVETHFGVTVDLDELDRLVDLNGVAEVLAEALEARPPAQDG